MSSEVYRHFSDYELDLIKQALAVYVEALAKQIATRDWSNEDNLRGAIALRRRLEKQPCNT